MSTYSFERGQRIDVVLRGYFVYSMGGFTRIALEPLDEDMKDTGGEYTLEIVDGFFVGEPQIAPQWDNGVILKMTGLRPGLIEVLDPEQPFLLVQFHALSETPYRIINGTTNTARFTFDQLRKHYGNEIKLEPLYIEDFDG